MGPAGGADGAKVADLSTHLESKRVVMSCHINADGEETCAGKVSRR